MEAILIDATMYTLMDQYRQNLTHQLLLFIRTIDKLCICKCTKNQIVVNLNFSAVCINSEYRQNLVTAKYKCFTVHIDDNSGINLHELLLLLLLYCCFTSTVNI